MDVLATKRLEERVHEKVDMVLTEGDQDYLRGLCRDALLEVLETELRFLGLYRHNDRESPALIHALLEENIDMWREYYFGKK
jgi:hypothetical protein